MKIDQAEFDAAIAEARKTAREEAWEIAWEAATKAAWGDAVRIMVIGAVALVLLLKFGILI